MEYKPITIRSPKEGSKEWEKRQVDLERIVNFQNGNAFFCGYCGKGIPEERKYFVELFQTKIFENNFVVTAKCICPFCGCRTQIQYTSKNSAVEYIKKIALYNNE